MAGDRPGPPASLRVGVIGSGLSAVGAVKALVKLGLKPTVLDWGEKLETDRAQQVESLAAKAPQEWNPEERAWLNRNQSLDKGDSIPKKRVFDSGYFYGTSRPEAPVENSGNIPAFSYALGGLSSGWGAAVMPAQACDLSDWPVGAEELAQYCRIVLSGLPYSAADDGLSLNFPVLSDKAKPLPVSRSGKLLLEALAKARVLKRDEVVFGHSRLMIATETFGPWSACRYCGQCMSGCVYKAIYKAGDEILDFHRRGEVDYEPSCLVDRLEEAGEKVTVHYLDGHGKRHQVEFDRVFLAAGAVNSARIVMNSLGLWKEKAVLRSRGGFVLPVLSWRKLPSDWPDCNTEPGLFVEFRGRGLDHWVHVQVSTENELLLKMLGVQGKPGGLWRRFKRFVARHLFLLLVNYHSDHSGTYELGLAPPGPEGRSVLHTVHRKSYPQWGVLWATMARLLGLLGRIECLPLIPLAKLNSGSYHVGGTLPMREQPSSPLETDILGRVGAWKKVHVVDTAVFPSLPGTTIGLLSMANAYRIVDQTPWIEAPQR